MKKLLCVILAFLFLVPALSLARGIVLEGSTGVYLSILYKQFTPIKYGGKPKIEWISVQTNVPRFKTVVPDYKKFHGEEVIETFLINDWRCFYIPIKAVREHFSGRKNFKRNLPGRINLGNDIYVYEKPVQERSGWTQAIIDYRINSVPEIEINFDDEGRKLFFHVIMPIYGDSETWNKFDYGGGPVKKFILEDVVKKYEQKLREEEGYK